MNLQKLRAMNLGAVADELEELRKFKAEIESQVPVGLVKTIGGYPDESEHRVDWLVRHHQLVDGQDLYTKPVPADKSTRITEKDIQEIANHIFGYISVLYPESAFENWFSKFGGRELLNKLNADREQVPAVAVPDDVYEALANELWELGFDAKPGYAPQLGEVYKILDKYLAIAPSHNQHNSNDEGFKLIPNPPCGFNLIAYNRHTEEWLYINHANTWQLFQGPNQGIKRLTKVEEWRESLTEMVQAMRSYEMDVDEPAPHKHRAMMDQAEALLAAAPPYSQQSAGDWLPVSVVLPPEGEPFQAFHENWIDEDFNVYGIRECHRYGDGTQYASAKWFDHQDCWIMDSEVPQLWRPYVKPDRCPSHESEQGE